METVKIQPGTPPRTKTRKLLPTTDPGPCVPGAPNKVQVPHPEALRQLGEAARVLLASDRILITSHVSPDGDAIGSVLALAHALRDKGKSTVVALTDPPPPYCAFLPGAELITPVAPPEPFAVAVVCDAAGIDRIGSVQTAAAAAACLIEIDHHLVTRPFGQIRAVDERCFATAELIYHLLILMDVTISPEIATCLMMGVVTDTGAFRFTNVNDGTFRLAGVLMHAGADLDRIMDQVYDQKSVSSLLLLEKAVSHLKLKDGFASATLSLEEFREAGATQQDAEGLIANLRSLSGVLVAAVLREASPNEIRVSLRGRPGVNVAAIAAEFGGGGHAAASGCTIRQPLEKAEEQLRNVVTAVLSTTGAASAPLSSGAG